MKKELYYITTSIHPRDMFLYNVRLRSISNTSKLPSNIILLEGKVSSTVPSWDCYFFSYTRHMRIAAIESCSPLKNLDNFTAELLDKYNDIFIQVEKGICAQLSDIDQDIAVLSNLSFGDICVLCPKGRYEYNHINKIVDNVFSMWENRNEQIDTSNEDISELKQLILKRFNKYYIFKRNPRYNEYKKLLNALMNLNAGSNDRTMYLLTQCALLIRTILDETSVRWVYESGDLKSDTFESSIELSQAFDLIMASYQNFLDQE